MQRRRVMILPRKRYDSQSDLLEPARIVGPPAHVEYNEVLAMLLSQEVDNLLIDETALTSEIEFRYICSTPEAGNDIASTRGVM